ncbi:hypothetical protein ABWI01_03460 [Oceanicaulis alexandrii]|uniref:hypothetical protein n=1 Tax=Oceanicaulis alexandrii TaxID=153233 RepID=UPI0035D122E4
MSGRGRMTASAEARKARQDQERAGREARARLKADNAKAAQRKAEQVRAALAERAAEPLPDWVARIEDPKERAKIRDNLDADEFEARRDRERLFHQVKAELSRRTQTAEVDVFSAIARGLVSEGKHLRSLAPTKQIAELGLGRGRNPAVLNRKQLAAACAWHHLWLETRYGAAAVDPSRVKVDGGGGGDAELGMIRAAESAKRLKRLHDVVARDGTRGKTMLELLIWVLEKDLPLKGYSLVKTLNVSGRDQLQGARLLLLTDALSIVARQLGY